MPRFAASPLRSTSANSDAFYLLRRLAAATETQPKIPIKRFRSENGTFDWKADREAAISDRELEFAIGNPTFRSDFESDLRSD